jgi:hypothetical protein
MDELPSATLFNSCTNGHGCLRTSQDHCGLFLAHMASSKGPYLDRMAREYSRNTQLLLIAGLISSPGEITPSYILHTRAFGTYLLGGGVFTLQKRL